MCAPNGVGRESHTQDIYDNMKRELMRIFSDNGKKEETVDKKKRGENKNCTNEGVFHVRRGGKL